MTEIGRALEVLMREHGIDVAAAAERLQGSAAERGVRLEEEARRIVAADLDPPPPQSAATADDETPAHRRPEVRRQQQSDYDAWKRDRGSPLDYIAPGEASDEEGPE